MLDYLESLQNGESKHNLDFMNSPSSFVMTVTRYSFKVVQLQIKVVPRNHVLILGCDFFIGDDILKAVLFIHGLSAKKEDNEYFIKRMNDFKNIELFTFTLPGHENDIVTKVTNKEWLDKSEEELQKILTKYKKVTIVAHSMGTIIAVNLASKYKEVEKLVLISSAFKFGSFKQNRTGGGRRRGGGLRRRLPDQPERAADAGGGLRL